MKQLFKFLPLLALLFGLMKPTTSHASHAAGAEIIYEWRHDSTYHVYLKFYRDCSGTTEPGSFTLCYSNPCASPQTYYTEPMPKVPNSATFINGLEIGTGCPGYFSTCANGTFPGYREWWYECEITLPERCDNWILSTTLSARNTSTNLTGQGTAYFEATLNNLDVQNNSSPFFSVKPVPYACSLNSPYTYNNGAVDPNSDSLVFDLIAPRNFISGATCGPTGVIQNAPYQTSYPYSPANPLQNSAFAFDPFTGQMDFTATATGAYTLTVRCSDYRNGIKVGSVLRDVQLQILLCSSAKPELVVNSATMQGCSYVGNRVLACANLPFSFTFDATSISTSAVLVPNDNHTSVAPGSTVTYTGQTTPALQGNFTWTPGTADTGLKIFTVTVKDSNCAPPGILISQTFTIPIYIRPALASFRSLPACPELPITLTSNGASNTTWDVAPGGDDVTSLSCVNCPVTIARPSVSTIYIAKSLQTNGCTNTDSFSLQVDNSNTITISNTDPLVVCRPTTIQLGVSTAGPKPLLNLSCGAAPGIPPTPADSTEFIPAQAQVQSAASSPSSPLLENFGTARHQYLLLARDLRYSGQHSGTLTGLAFRFVPNSGGASMRNVRISLKCTGSPSLNAATGFETGTLPVYDNASTVQIPAGGGYVRFNFTTPYNWDTTQNLIVDICYSNAGPVNPGPTLFSTTGYTSNLYSFAVTGSLCNGGSAPNLTASNEIPVMKLFYNLAPEGDWTYRWDNGVFLPHANISNPTTYVPKSKQIWVTTRNRNGCDITDTLTMYMPEHAVLPRDTNICEGHPVQLMGLHAKHYAWYENGFNPATSLNCTDCADPVALPKETTTYTAVLTDDFGCADTFYTKIIVTRYPDLELLTQDTTIIYGESITLEAVGADHYYWTPVNTLSNPGFRRAIATPEETTVYTVMGSVNANSSCRVYDSVKVTVSTKWPLMVPSAFSPNGDGRNDVFRVVNLTFQKVQEFRVFNRWGQQVYSATDNSGWDGTHNGKAQELGTYQYLIRLAIPDGETKVYKGDVSLIR